MGPQQLSTVAVVVSERVVEGGGGGRFPFYYQGSMSLFRHVRVELVFNERQVFPFLLSF